MRRRVYLVFLVAVILLATILSAHAVLGSEPAQEAATLGEVTETFTPAQDALIFEGDPGKHYGAYNWLRVGRSPASESYYILIQFDLSSLPPDAQVVSASLKLHPPYNLTATDVGAAESLRVYTNIITSQWTESSVTWSTRPSAVPSSDPATDVPEGGTWHTWNVTNTVGDWVSGTRDNNGFLMWGNAPPNTARTFSSREGYPSPKLVVTYTTTTPTATATRTTTGTRTSTATASPTRTPTPTATRTPMTCNPNQPIIIEADQDTWTDSENPTFVGGSESRLFVHYGPPDSRYTFLHFPIENVVPPDAYIYHAQVRLFVSDTGFSGEPPGPWYLSYFGLNAPFDEATTNWSNQPAIYGPYDVAEISGGMSYTDLDVAALMQWWRSGEANNGLGIAPLSHNFTAGFWSREVFSASPQLRITCGGDPPTPTPTPTEIPIVLPGPFLFELGNPPPDNVSQMVFGDERVTQGLDWDVTAGVAYDRVAGKDTLARFTLHTDSGTIEIKDAACQVIMMDAGSPNGYQARGLVPGEMAGSTIGPEPTSPGSADPGKTVNCWIPGDMLWPKGYYYIKAYVNSTDNYLWTNVVGEDAWLFFHETTDYFGWFMMIAYWDPAYFGPGERHPVDPITPDILANLVASDLPTLQRLWPLRAGIEQVQGDGSNAHAAGLRFLLAPSSYRCGAEEQENPIENPLTGDPDPKYTCVANMRAFANAQFEAYNLAVSAAGAPFEVMHLGTVIEPFDTAGGGQSCWTGHKVAGQAISSYPSGGAVMAHEPAHCLGLVYQGPHTDPSNPGHSSTADIPLFQGQPVVNLRKHVDYFTVQANMNPFIYRPNDEHMMEGFEWNRLRGILLGSDPCAGGCAQQAAAESARRFFLSGRVDRDDRWETRYSMVVDAAVPVDPTPARGSHAVLVLDSRGRELVRWPFDASFETADGPPAAFAEVNATLPYPDAAAMVRIVHGEATLAELRPPARGPSVSLQHVTINGATVEAQWVGEHPDGAPLRYSLYFSPDGGESRVPLAVGLASTTFTWETDLAQGTENARLIVVASDGFHTAEATSGRFAIARKPPVAKISHPYVPPRAMPPTRGDDGSNVQPSTPISATVLVAGQPVELRGTGFDLNDGLLDGENLRWASDRQGPLGIGDQLTVKLEAGKHLLTLQAIASSGLIGDDTVTVEVLADQDRDGMPDDYEDKHGCLDKRDRGDADKDRDRDGMTALAEFGRGTDPCDADTDNDRVKDGDEVRGGSDPLNPRSVPPPPLAAQPAPFRLVGCGSLPAPRPRLIWLDGADVPYTASSDVDWLDAQRGLGGHLLLRVDCSKVEASPAAARVLLTAKGRQPLVVTGSLWAGEASLYLPLFLQGQK